MLRQRRVIPVMHKATWLPKFTHTSWMRIGRSTPRIRNGLYANADLRGVEQRLRAESAVAEPDSEILLKQLEAKPELMDAFTKKFV